MSASVVRCGAWLLIGVLVGCSTLAPGSDPLGRSLKQQVELTVVPAVAEYQQSRGEFPKSIHLLNLDLKWIPNDARLAYRRQDAGPTTDPGYLIALFYPPSGSMASRTQCLLPSSTQIWQCQVWEQQ